MKELDFFMLFANCIVVKGQKKAVLCDLQYQRFKLIPLLLANILLENKAQQITVLLSKYKSDSHQFLDIR
mgnify:CR=1 FL=1